MIDVHCHILPGIDDGAKSSNESIAMARAAMELGVEGIICTPHVQNKEGSQLDREGIERAVQELAETFKREGVDIELYPGAEYYLDKPFPALLRDNHPLATINNTYYIVVEFPMLHMPPYLEYSILKTDLDDPDLERLLPLLRVIVAHPERNEDIIRKPERIFKLKESGAIIQMNLGSIMGIYGRQVKKTAEKLLKMEMVDLVATDAHSEEHMRAALGGAAKKLKKMVGEETFSLIWEKNPQSIALGKNVEQL